MSLAPLVEPAAELTIDEVRRYSRHLIIPDVGMDGSEAAQERQGARHRRRRPRQPRAALPGRGRRRHARHRGVRRGRRVQPAAPGHPRPERHRAVQGESPRGVDRARPTRTSTCRAPRGALDNDNVMRVFERLRPDRRRHRQLRDPLHGQRRGVLPGQALRLGLDLPLRRPGVGLRADRSARPRATAASTPSRPPPGMVPCCAEGGVLGVLCASIGSIQVTEAIKLITGIGEPLRRPADDLRRPRDGVPQAAPSARTRTARSAARTRPSPS